MLQIAIERGIDADSLAKLVDLNERMLANQAKREFHEALQMFQKDCPPIPKNKSGYGDRYRYATLDHITATISDLLYELGLSYTFETNFKEDKVSVTCTVYHRAGHSISSTVALPFDNSNAGMNAAQSTASVIAYGKRYSLCNSLGITTADTDDDAYSVGERQRRERSGDAGEEQFNDIKRRYVELINPQGGKAEQKRQFEKWIVDQTGMKATFANDWKRWLPAHFEQCNDALDEVSNSIDPDFK